MSRRKKTKEEVELNAKRADRLREAMGGIRQDELASKWRQSRTTISDRLSGRTTISDKDAQQLCEIINNYYDEREEKHGNTPDPDKHIRFQWILCQDDYKTVGALREAEMEDRVLGRVNTLTEHLHGVLYGAVQQLNEALLFSPPGGQSPAAGYEFPNIEQRARMAEDLLLYAKFLIHENATRTAYNKRQLEIAQDISAMSLGEIIDRLKAADPATGEAEAKEKATTMKVAAAIRKDYYEGGGSDGEG